MQTIMKTSDNGLHFLANKEGIRYSVYDDATGKVIKFGQKCKGNPTVGIGHLILAGEKFPYAPAKLTEKQVYDLFRKDLARYENAINKYVKVKLTQNQFDALVSFCFNIGIGGFAGSSALKYLNAGDYKGAAVALLLWRNPGLYGRRMDEKALFSK
jgi:lysozyme